jgi:hypothetical protein
LLKLKPSTEQWFGLLEETLTGRAEIIREIMALHEDPDAVFREIYRTKNTRLVFKVLSLAAGRAKGQSRTQMIERVRVQKMRELVIQNDPMILRNLDLPGPADYMPPSQSSQRGQQRRHEPSNGGHRLRSQAQNTMKYHEFAILRA